jgi:hypothetical protein
MRLNLLLDTLSLTLSHHGQCREVKPACHCEPACRQTGGAKQSLFAAEIASSLALLAMTDIR